MHVRNSSVAWNGQKGVKSCFVQRHDSFKWYPQVFMSLSLLFLIPLQPKVLPRAKFSCPSYERSHTYLLRGQILSKDEKVTLSIDSWEQVNDSHIVLNIFIIFKNILGSVMFEIYYVALWWLRANFLMCLDEPQQK